jgi:hypothetical protein
MIFTSVSFCRVIVPLIILPLFTYTASQVFWELAGRQKDRARRRIRILVMTAVFVKG